MNYPSWLALGTGTLFLVTGPVCGQTGRTRGPEQILGIHLYDQAQVPAGVLHAAIVEVARLFRAAGIRISWEQPLVEAPEDRGLDMSARKSVPFWPPDQRSYLVARLVRGMPASALPGALGFALPGGRSGTQVTIFYDRVEALTPSVPTASYIILGHALAHEIGHVLLGSSEHAHDGLMQARWNPVSWHLASAGLLAFRPAEAAGMCARLRGRRVPEPEPTLAWSAPRHAPE